MKSIRLRRKIRYKRWDFEQLKFIEIFRNAFVNFSIDYYDVGVKTPMMYKNRPEGSCKIIIPFEGKLKVITEQQSVVFDPEHDGLSLIIIGQKEKRQFENVGNIPARVLAIYAPPFHIREIDHIVKNKKKRIKI